MENSKSVILVGFVLVFVLGLLAGKIINEPQKLENNTNENEMIIDNQKEKTKSLDEKIEEIRKNDNIVFLGDSITDFYPLDDIFLDLPIVNSGKSGYRTTNILEEMDTLVYRYNPTKVILLIGTNDLSSEDENIINDVENNIVKIVKNIQENRKNAKVYIESIYPVNKEISGNVAAERNNEKAQEVNKFLKNYCKENNLVYIDMYGYLTDSNGNFDSKYTDDGLHANKLGYARISQVLVKYLYDLDV